jgi:predicted dinucleotide-utilizing enzyme
MKIGSDRHVKKGRRICIPSGVIAGLDGIKSASIGRIESVLLISRKLVAAVRGSKYVVERNLPLDSLTADTVIFEGLAEGATRALPAASNVAASLCPFSLLTRAASSRASTCQSMVAQFPDNPPSAQFRLIEPSENTTL